MLFLLRSETEPMRTLRETEDDGYDRTFWLWPRGEWVVAVRSPDGEVGVTCAPGLRVSLEDGGSVAVVAVGNG